MTFQVFCFAQYFNIGTRSFSTIARLVLKDFSKSKWDCYFFFCFAFISLWSSLIISISSRSLASHIGTIILIIIVLIKALVAFVFNWWNCIIKSSYLAKNCISQIPFLLSLERQLRSLFSTHLFFSNIFSLSFQTYVLPLHLKTNYTHFSKRKTSLKKSYSFSISISSMFFLTICCPLPLCCKNTAIRKRK